MTAKVQLELYLARAVKDKRDMNKYIGNKRKGRENVGTLLMIVTG